MMARMIPPYIGDEVKSTGERQIFELFRSDPDTEGWVVLHSLTLSKHVKRLYGEIDFLVLAPGLGIFCLEVKSGNVSRKDGMWLFTNKHGEVSRKNRGPFEQAREGMFTLRSAICNKYGTDSRYSRLVYGFGVMFPHILFSVQGLEFEGWQVYDRDSRKLPINKYIKCLASNTKKHVQDCNWFDEVESIPDQNTVNQLADFLRGDFERLITPKQRLYDIEERIDKYTSEQFSFLDQLQDNPRCLFLGAAGTGKSMLAIESCKRSLFKGERVLFLCYNRLFGEWLKMQLNDTEYMDSLYVGTFHSLLFEISGKHGNKDSVLSDEYFRYDLPIMALEEIDKGVIRLFDKLIIDEGQDLICDEYLDVLNGLVKGGLAGGKWEIYGDFEKQAIYSDTTAEVMMECLTQRSSFIKFRLTVNCRNTKPIGEEVSLLAGFETPKFLSTNIDGLPVDYQFWTSSIQQSEKLQNILNELKKQGIINERITILSPMSFNNSIASRLDKSKYKIVDMRDCNSIVNDRWAINFSTIHGYKGLENSYIIITDVNRLSDPEFQSLLYVAMSRAKVSLHVLLSASTQKEFKEIINKGVLKL